MAIPKVFISSTCYDLKYIRDNIKYFIKTLGYEPILSEDGGVYFDPKIHTHDACIAEVPNTQIFVLIIGGRFGGNFKETEHSITNAEYREAVKHKIPVFALVENTVYSDHFVFTSNKNNPDVDETKIKYPSVDSTSIFDFIDEVRRGTTNNAIVSFNDFSNIESYLKSQWAGMMFSFLVQQNEAERVRDTFSALKEINQRIEMLSKQILASVGTDMAKLTVRFYDQMMQCECVKDLIWYDIQPTPLLVITCDSYHDLIINSGLTFTVDNEKGMSKSLDSLGGKATMPQSQFDRNVKQYKELRDSIIEQLTNDKVSVEDYIKSTTQI